MVSPSHQAITKDKWVSDLGGTTQNHNFTEAHMMMMMLMMRMMEMMVMTVLMVMAIMILKPKIII